MPTSDPLAGYRGRRSPERTPEPFGSAGAGAGRFCIQKHAATRTHYDLRLELRGVLKSWAVPKGPSPDPAEKRLAVQVEDHPLSYVDFEGVIPEGEYGAGPMIVWDLGRWTALEDPERGLADGKLLFRLHGYKLRGTWTLVRIAGGETGREWLLIRERRDLAGGAAERAGGWTAPDETPPEPSVLSGLTVEELGARAAGRLDPAEGIRRTLEALEANGARRRDVDPDAVAMMLARTRRRPFSDPAWAFELKLDGYRMLGIRRGGRPRLRTRGGKDATRRFPELARALAALPYGDLVLDGEVVVHDGSGHPSFQRLQARAQLTGRSEIRRAAAERPAAFHAFDLLAFEGWDLRPLPLLERKALLGRLLPPAGPLRPVEHFLGAGEALYQQVRTLGLEGVMAKRADSSYQGGRRAEWLKIHAPRAGAFAVVGFTEPEGRRRGLGALHLAAFPADEPGTDDPGAPGERPTLVYAGKVGTGFREAQLVALRHRLEPLRTPRPACVGAPPGGRGDVWVEPRLACEVRFKERTEQGLLRAPVFLRLLEADRTPGHDREPESARAPAAEAAEREAPSARPAAGAEEAWSEAAFSNLDKVFWPEDGYTKGDLIGYYRAIARWLLPYLEDRPVVLTRFPDGISGKSFFQKDAPDHLPDWIRTETVWSRGAERPIDYIIVEDEATLLHLANLATIPLHLWASRTPDLDRPDWCLLDLDPKEAPFEDVITLARALRRLCEELELPSFVKTSGSTGLHVLIPLGGTLTHEDARGLGELLARLVAAEHPGIATLTRPPEKREGKVYLDYLQNGRGRLMVAPYAVRALPGAPVSAPLRWREVRPGLTLDRFDIRSMPRRVRAMKEEPLRPLLALRPDLPGALARLERRLV